MTGQGDEILHFHIRFRNGAGFVHAQHIHPGQGFDAVHILHQHLILAQFQSRGRQGDGGQQVQPLRDHAHQRRHGALHAVPEAQLQHEKFLMKQDQSHGHQQDAHHQDQPVQRAHHFGLSGLGVLLCLLRQPGGEGILPHCRQLHPAPARQNHGPRLYRVTFGLGNGVGLAGDEGFVHPHFAAAQNAVGADLVALSKFRNIVPDDGLRGYFLLFAVPDDGDRPSSYQGQLIHRPFCPDLLHNADDGIDGRHHQKAHVHHRGAADDQHRRQDHENQVKKRKAVGQDDLLLGFARMLRRARRFSFCRLLGSQALFRVDAVCCFCLFHGGFSQCCFRREVPLSDWGTH